MNVQPSNPNNPIVFFDVTIGGQVRPGVYPLRVANANPQAS